MSDAHLRNSRDFAKRLSLLVTHRALLKQHAVMDLELEDADDDTILTHAVTELVRAKAQLLYLETAIQNFDEEIERRAEADLLDECGVSGMDRYGSLQH